MDLRERLDGVARILAESHQELSVSPIEDTGFVPADPARLIAAILCVMGHADFAKKSLDLGCGNGSWALMIAAAGYSSFGIEINPLLFDHAQRNLMQGIRRGFIDEGKCTLVLGDMVPVKFSKAYDAYRRAHSAHPHNMPVGAVVNDAYGELSLSMATADIIYCWAWPTQSRFVFNMLAEEAKEGALFVLPSYLRYTQGEFLQDLEEENRLFLTPLLEDAENYVGVRRREGTVDASRPRTSAMSQRASGATYLKR